MPLSPSEAAAAADGYVSCAMRTSDDWRATGDGTLDGESLDTHYRPQDIVPESIDRMVGDVDVFLLLAASEIDAAIAAGAYPDGAFGIGHDLWMSRNGYGPGFSVSVPGDLGDGLDSIAVSMGSRCLVIDEAGDIRETGC